MHTTIILKYLAIFLYILLLYLYILLNEFHSNHFTTLIAHLLLTYKLHTYFGEKRSSNHLTSLADWAKDSYSWVWSLLLHISGQLGGLMRLGMAKKRFIIYYLSLMIKNNHITTDIHTNILRYKSYSKRWFEQLSIYRVWYENNDTPMSSIIVNYNHNL